MYRVLTSCALIAIGAAILVIVRHGYLSGEVPAGVAWLGPYRPNRGDNPFAFRLYLALYFASGIALIVWGILALFGAAEPIRLR